jgi:hypothetical protein
VNQPAVEITVDLVPEPADPGLDDIGQRVEIVVPDVLHDHASGHHPPGVAHEVLEKGELEGLEVDPFPLPEDLPGEEVHFQVSHGKARGFRRSGGPAEKGLDPGEKFGEGERLGQVVVAPLAESPDPVLNRSPGAPG